MIDLNHSRNLTSRQRAYCFLELTEPVSGRKPVLALLIPLLWVAALLLPVVNARAGVVFTTLYSFTAGNDGRNPYAELVQNRIPRRICFSWARCRG
jgi:hypothetical protein